MIKPIKRVSVNHCCFLCHCHAMSFRNILSWHHSGNSSCPNYSIFLINHSSLWTIVHVHVIYVLQQKKFNIALKKTNNHLCPLIMWCVIYVAAHAFTIVILNIYWFSKLLHFNILEMLLLQHPNDNIYCNKLLCFALLILPYSPDSLCMHIQPFFIRKFVSLARMICQ